MAYGQKNYNEIQGINGKYRINQIGCFLVSFCNLLTDRFGHNANPLGLNAHFRDNGIYIDVDDGIRDDLGWGSVSAVNSNVVVSQTGGVGWPTSDNSIVKFVYKSPNTGRMTTHFCLVASAANRTIVDSWDGVVKAPGIYGTPQSWASYTLNKPQPVQPVVTVAPPPASVPVPAQPNIKYELFDKPKRMRIKKSGGAEKWAFGNAKEWKDFTSVAHANEGDIVEVVGQAIHPVPPTGAVYLMDKSALGDFANTGKPAQTIGFNRVDLEDAPAPPPEPSPVVPPTPTIANEPEPVNENNDNVPVTVTPVTTVDPVNWKDTYKDEIADFTANDNVWVKDLDNVQPTLGLVKGQIVHQQGVFEKDGVLYARTKKSVKNNWWYGIPRSMLTKLDGDIDDALLDLNDLDLGLEIKELTKTLNSREKMVMAVAKTEGFFIRLWRAITFKNKKENK